MLKESALPDYMQAYSVDPKLRRQGQTSLIKRFLEKAATADATYIICNLEKSLHLESLDDDVIAQLVELAHEYLGETQLEEWFECKLLDAVRVHAFEKAKFILSRSPDFINVSVDCLIITDEIIGFLESQRDKVAVRPFLNLNWYHNLAGHEGFLRLVRVVPRERMERHIRKPFQDEAGQYGPLGCLAQEGLLDDVFSEDVVQLLVARSIIEVMNGEIGASETHLRHIASLFSHTQLLKAFSTEAKVSGNAPYVLDAMARLLPYLKDCTQ